ncbi:hypothetical protein L6164_012373 [Bauhinia variegata]|uniref:Uncharacterized protein n=1 Tax=Bauhinia variegata TaxID=167791 RepID=A0ACB9PA57_BAUVA|nr:hypothetical protein L6164_012373 [Bauhinia variegata]
MTENSKERRSGCGILSAVFGRRSVWGRKTGSTDFGNNNGSDFGKALPNNINNPKRRRADSKEFIVLDSSSSCNATTSKVVSATKPETNPNRATSNPVQVQPRKIRQETAKTSTSKMGPSQGNVNQGKRVTEEAIGLSGELESMITDHQKTKGSSVLLRASSSNVMLYGNLGNLRQGGGGNTDSSYNVTAHTPKVSQESQVGNGRYTNHAVETANNRVSKEGKSKQEQQSGSLCRALSTRMDPEQLKIMGNEDYKNGRFAEALALYDAAISIDPNKASYRSNRSAALTALGRILEAVFECREAIQIEPNYLRAHHRLGNLYLRLGETDKAQYHFKRAGAEADPDEIAKVKILQTHLNKCTEARRLRDWNTLIKETNGAISAAADSAPQIFALQAEALLKLHKHQDADEAISRGPHFDDEECIKFLGPVGYASVLVTRSQVDLAVGRFDEALEAAQRAAKLDSNNREANMVLRRSRAVAAARTNGNQLFKASKFYEAFAAYAAGLEHDPYNSVLLCNRAACRSKLGHYEKAVEDCTVALNLRPSYSKARLRRADCNAKLQRWEASIQEYEILLRQTPEDEEVKQALAEAQEQLQKRQG